MHSFFRALHSLQFREAWSSQRGRGLTATAAERPLRAARTGRAKSPIPGALSLKPTGPQAE
eukprot:4003842-Alexandrium_andersonii.AAC.1